MEESSSLFTNHFLANTFMSQALGLLSLPPELRRLIWEAVADVNSQAVNAIIRCCQQILHEFLPIIFALRPGTYASGKFKYDLVIALEPTCVPGEWLRFYCLPSLGRNILKRKVLWEDEPRRRFEARPCSQVIYKGTNGGRDRWAPLIGITVADMDDPIIDIMLNLPNLTNVTVVFEHPELNSLDPRFDEAFLCQWAKAQDVLYLLKMLPRIEKFGIHLSNGRQREATDPQSLNEYWQKSPWVNEYPWTTQDSSSVSSRLLLPFVRLKARYSATTWDYGKGNCRYDLWDDRGALYENNPIPHPTRNHCYCEGLCTSVLLHRVADLITRKKREDIL